MATQYTKEFKEDAVRYYLEHKELGLSMYSKNLGISKNILHNWKDNNGEVPSRGRGNFESDAAKENARLRKELRDTQDALQILKKAIGNTGKLTEVLFIETHKLEKKFIKEQKRRLNVSGVLRILGVSRSGYQNFKKRKPSKQEIRKKEIKKAIQTDDI